MRVRRRPRWFLALALGSVLGLSIATPATAALRARSTHETKGAVALLPAQPGNLLGVATTRGGAAWAVGYSGTLDTDSAPLALSWNGARWQRMPIPTLGAAQLDGVAMTSPTNVWAVGSVGLSPNAKTLILERKGKKWLQMPGTPGSLSGVTALSPSDAWAVGATNDGATLILHWNGKTWRQTPSPGTGWLNGLASSSPSDVWAVGGTTSQDSLILHWNGTVWQQVTSVSVGADQGLGSNLAGVTAASKHAAWAVGEGGDCGCGPGVPLVQQWNGETWSQVHAPEANMNLSAVASLSTRPMWAVGERGDGDSPTTPVILQVKGSAWTPVPVPALENDNGSLSGVAVTSRSDAWAVGWASAAGSAGAGQGEGESQSPAIAILHWNGSTWVAMTTPGAAPPGAAASTNTPTSTPSAASTTSTSTSTTTTTSSTSVPPTTAPTATAAGGPLLGSAAWGEALGSMADISGFGVAAPTEIAMGGTAQAPHVFNISWSNWGASMATGQGQSIDGNNQSGPVSSWPLEPADVVAFDLGSCDGGPPAYEEVTWYFPGDGQTFDPTMATNACTGD